MNSFSSVEGAEIWSHSTLEIILDGIFSNIIINYPKKTSLKEWSSKQMK